MKTSYILEAIYDARKSFYGKAKVIREDLKNGGFIEELKSYDTIVARTTFKNNTLFCEWLGDYSQTTTRHQKEFFKQTFLNDEEIIELRKKGTLTKSI